MMMSHKLWKIEKSSKCAELSQCLAINITA